MKSYIKNLALAAIVAMCATSCDEEKFVIEEEEKSDAVVLLASTSSTAQSRVSFTENTGTSAIDLLWEVDDAFTVYGSDGSLVGNFTCSSVDGDGVGTFLADENVELTSGGSYTAIYPASTKETLTAAQAVDLTSVQNGDDISKLNNACYMEEEFTYSSTTSLTFDHKKAVMTFQFTSASRPAKLVFENGTAVYTVNYTDIVADANLYTSYIMIEPCAGDERTLTFSLYDSEGTAYDIRTVPSSKAYEAGVRYTSPVSDLDPTIWLGSGSESDPYQITTAAQLRELSDNVNTGISYEGEYFMMTNDIDLNNEEFDGIGNLSYKFSGTFDGGGYKVSGLYIYQSGSNFQALFGYTNVATIKNLGVSGSVTGAEYVGGVVGYSNASTVSNCYNTASIEGTTYVGGVVGWSNSSTVRSCYSAASIEGSTSVGGVVGYNAPGSGVYYSYYDNTLYSGDAIGSAVSPIITEVVGYSTSVMKSGYLGALLNNGASKASNSSSLYAWTTSVGDYPTLDIDATPTDAGISDVSSCTQYGLGTSSMPYVIFNGNQMRDLASDVNSGTSYSNIYFSMVCDINLEGSDNAFTPIGNSYNKFSGIFDGGGYEVSDLYVYSSTESYKGLFGNISGATIKYLGVSGEVTGSGYIGGIVGNNTSSTVSDCYYSGSVKGANNVGGVVGYNTSAVTNCYNTGSVTGNSNYAGGVVGYNTSTVTNCYNTGGSMEILTMQVVLWDIIPAL